MISPENAAIPLIVSATLVGAAYLIEGPSAPSSEGPEVPVSAAVRVLRGLVLPVILLAVLARGYLGPVLHDWPFCAARTNSITG
ncbi:MAG: hypothetical protein H0W54_00090 [Rubrobacter sp.]|nr:hypothetical protein [Rubrobacter sp.]